MAKLHELIAVESSLRAQAAIDRADHHGPSHPHV